MFEREIFRASSSELAANRKTLDRIASILDRRRLHGPDAKLSQEEIDGLLGEIGNCRAPEKIRRYLSGSAAGSEILFDRRSGEIKFIAQSYIDPRHSNQQAWLSVTRDAQTGAPIVADYFDGSVGWPQYRVLRTPEGRLLSAQKVGFADYVMG